MSRFEGKAALVTGAASGIGRAVALRLANEGARVLACDIAEVSIALDGVVAHRCDVSSPDECRAAVAACLDAFGRLDVLGNVAGIAIPGHATDVSEDEYRRMMAVNVDGPFFLAQAAIPHLLERGGVIVNIASNAGIMGIAYFVVYSMTKGAIVQLTRSLAMEYAKTSLRVVAIAPGGINTPLAAGVRFPPDVDFDLIRPYTGFRGQGEPEDIAALFAFVASDEGRNIHGAILPSDLGLSAG